LVIFHEVIELLMIHTENPQSSLDNVHTSIIMLDDLGNYMITQT